MQDTEEDDQIMQTNAIVFHTFILFEKQNGNQANDVCQEIYGTWQDVWAVQDDVWTLGRHSSII